MRIRHTLLSALALSVATAAATSIPAHANDPAAALGSVVINEVSSNGFTHHGATNTDFIELHNKGSQNVDLTGYFLTDDKGFASADKLTLDGVLPAGGYAVFIPPPFGLGGTDHATLLSPTGDTIDSYQYAGHRNPSWARVPDGTGDFAITDAASGRVPTPGGPNTLTTAQAYVTISEYFSNGASANAPGDHDFIEIHNGGAAPIDVSGWYLSDGEGNPATAADKITLGGPSAIIPAGGYLAVETELHDSEIPTGFTYLPGSNGTKSGFGLNKLDHAYLFTDAGTLVADTYKGALPDAHADTWSRLAPGGLWKQSGGNRTPGAANTFPSTGGELPGLDANFDDVEINEISSLNAGQNGTTVGDAVELFNKGTAAVSVEGWLQTDSGALPTDATAQGAHRLRLTDLSVWNGTSLEPATSWLVPAGGYVVFSSKKGLSGEGDEVKVYSPDGTQLIDQKAYGNGEAGISDNNDLGAASYAANPDGGDTFMSVTFQTFGFSNAAAITAGPPTPTNVKINELSAAAGKVEVKNFGAAAVDLSGWTLDTGSTAHTVPAGTSLPAGGLYVADGVTLPVPGSVKLRKAHGAQSDEFSWIEDGNASYSRCVFGASAVLVETPTATFNAENACPVFDPAPWPGSQDVTIVDESNTFGDGDGNGEGDVSGVTFDPTDPTILWAVQNKNTLFKLRKNAATGKYDDVPGWNLGKKLHFADGTGQPDSEGVTVGPDGAVYVTSERDNALKGVSYNKVLRFDVSGDLSGATDLTATHEWDVNSIVTTGTNLGLEGITWVPDEALTAGGFRNEAGAAYAPNAYPGHGSGLFVVAVEGTGDLHAFALPRDGSTSGTPQLVRTIKSGFPWSMDVAWDADRKMLWALCDDGCGGTYNTLQLTDGAFEVVGSYSRPAAMPNLNNEGMAIAPLSTASGETVEVVWADDGDTDGHSLRGGRLWSTTDLSDPSLVPHPATASVTFTHDQLTYGTAATVVVSVDAPESVVTGSAQLFAGTTAIGAPADVVAGTATVTVPQAGLAPGQHDLTVAFTSADTRLVRDAVSPAARVTVAKGNVAKVGWRLTKRPTAQKAGTVVVTVGTPTGLAKATGRATLVIKKGSRTVRTITVRTVKNGTASLTLPRLKAGKYRVRVTWLGSSHYVAKAGGFKRLVVGKK